MWGGVGRARLFNPAGARTSCAHESAICRQIPGELLQLAELELDGLHLTYRPGGDEAKLGAGALLVMTEQARGFVERLTRDGSGESQPREQRFRASRELGRSEAQGDADAQ